jgi:hypothetical protein
VTVQAEQAPRRWIVTTEPEGINDAAAPPPPGNALPQPKTLVDGPWSSNLAKLVADLAPAGSRVASRTDFPELAAARVVFDAPGSNAVSVAVQQRDRPVTMTILTAYQNDGVLAEWPTGTQYVQIDRERHHLFQVILARPGAMFVTVSVSTRHPGQPIQWSGAFTRPSLVSKIRQILDTATIDNAVG